MADFKFIDSTMTVLKKSLDLLPQNQQVTASNIANAETPGYSARKLEFEVDLRNAINSPKTEIRTTSPKHFPIGTGGIEGGQGRIITQRDCNPFGDGNSVSLDDEMLDLAENQLLFEAGSQRLKKKLSLLKYVANDGK